MRKPLDQPVVLNQFTIWLKVPNGLSPEETHRRMQAAMFIINGVKKTAGVEVQIGPKLEYLLQEPQAPTSAELLVSIEKLHGSNMAWNDDKLVSRPIDK